MRSSVNPSLTRSGFSRCLKSPCNSMIPSLTVPPVARFCFSKCAILSREGSFFWDAVDLDQGHGPSERSKGEPYGDVARLSVQMTQFVFKCKILFSRHARTLLLPLGRDRLWCINSR